MQLMVNEDSQRLHRDDGPEVNGGAGVGCTVCPGQQQQQQQQLSYGARADVRFVYEMDKIRSELSLATGTPDESESDEDTLAATEQPAGKPLVLTEIVCSVKYQSLLLADVQIFFLRNFEIRPLLDGPNPLLASPPRTVLTLQDLFRTCHESFRIEPSRHVSFHIPLLQIVVPEYAQLTDQATLLHLLHALQFTYLTTLVIEVTDSDRLPDEGPNIEHVTCEFLIAPRWEALN